MYRRFLVLLCMSVVVAAFGMAAAQDGMVLTPGSGQVGSLSAEKPFLIYSFIGNEGDLVTVRVASLTPDMSLTATILSLSERQIGEGESGMFSETSVSAHLTEGGTYTIRVDGTPGDFVILFDVFAVAQAIPLIPYIPVTARLSPEAALQVYTLDASPASASSLELRSNSDDGYFDASLYDSDGRLTGFVSHLPDTCLSIPAGEGLYTLVIEAPNAEAEFDVVVVLRSLPCDSDGSEQVPPTVAAENEDASADVCRVTAGGMVNIRNGPGTDYAIIGGLNAGQSLTVLGTSGTGWYIVETESIEQSFISASLVYASGSCANLPTIQNGVVIPATNVPPTTQPTFANTPTPMPSPTVSPVQPTLTVTPSTTAVAPLSTPFPDADDTLTIPLDSAVSIAGSVSSDTEVQVNYEVWGMNPSPMLSGGRARLTLVISCSGTDAENVEILAAGETYSCDQTIFDQEVTYDSSSGGILITVAAGQNTDVQWELTGTAMRDK